MSTTTEAVSTNILVEITRQRLKRREVADKAGLSYTAFTRRLNGRSEFSINELERVAAALEVPLSDLLKDAA